MVWFDSKTDKVYCAACGMEMGVSCKCEERRLKEIERLREDETARRIMDDIDNAFKKGY